MIEIPSTRVQRRSQRLAGRKLWNDSSLPRTRQDDLISGRCDRHDSGVKREVTSCSKTDVRSLEIDIAAVYILHFIHQKLTELGLPKNLAISVPLSRRRSLRQCALEYLMWARSWSTLQDVDERFLSRCCVSRCPFIGGGNTGVPALRASAVCIPASYSRRGCGFIDKFRGFEPQ